MWKHMAIAIRFTVAMTVLLGIAYPLLVTGIAQTIFPKQAHGSIVISGGHAVGSTLLGQSFARPEYFHSRPSAAFDPSPSKDGTVSPDNYVSSGSNLAPTSKALAERVRQDVEAARFDNPRHGQSRVPVDMVTTSASGFDPDITPANAYAQAARVAKARQMPEDRVRPLIRDHTTRRQLGVLGEPRVNVLKLNLALDAEAGSNRG